MTALRKVSLPDVLSRVEFLPNRTPEMSLSGEAKRAFAEAATYRNGAIFIGYYSGNSEWERHPHGDEIVMVLRGNTTIVLRQHDKETRIDLSPQDLVVVPCNTWHRFSQSSELQVLTVTPQPTDHRVEAP